MKNKTIIIPATLEWTEREILEDIIDIVKKRKGYSGSKPDDAKIKIGITIMRNSPCRHCGECCSNLSFVEQIMISLHTKRFMFHKVCDFLRCDNLCDIYNNRPKLCREFKCGVFYDSRR